MRAFCTVSAPLEVCAPPTRPLSPGSRFLALRLLGTTQPRTLYFLVEAKSRIREVYTQTCLHFAKQGMLDAELFGLAVLIDGEYMFADPESKLSKYGPKSWRSSHTHGLDANGRPLLELHFRVQFYVESPFMLRDETSRRNYYLQLRANACSRDVPKDYSEQSMVLLSGLALQADFGDYPLDDEIVDSSNGGGGGAIGGGSNSTSRSSNINNPSIGGGAGSSLTTSSTSLATTSSGIHPVVSASSSNASSSNAAPDYFQIEDYIPPSIRSAWCRSALRACHRENRGMSRADAELTYIRQVCALHDTINAHVYRMKLSKSETGAGSVHFIIYSKGIKICGENTQPITFLWPNIIKLSFERKKFEIRSSDNKITLYSSSDEKNKMILTLCRETHQFSMKVAARLKEAMKREEEESSSLHACYMYSRSLNLPYKNKNDQRISVISSTSSNTTSGIVSDRVHSEDELEIMINTPPAVPIAAPSTESLALAHLLDRPSVSRQTSSVGQVSLKDLEDHLAALSVRSNTRSISSESTTDPSTDRSRGSAEANETDSPNSQHNIGSQCSSTCSTVVVATDTITLSSLSAHPASAVRRPSTSSSLELGFSHTAQNSTLSEGASTFIDNEFISTNDGEDECISGVYTLDHVPPTETSGVYTMNSSEMTGQSSEIAESESHESSHYGSFQPQSEIGDGSVPNIDSVDGQYGNCMDNEDIGEFRLRSDSNISASGSFRGDGSDPTDNKHTLLSAEELTDLIVGRGTYPSRKTVSSTLDSDCDYVTLPLPLEGDSYIQGHQDTAPTEDNDDIDELLKDPPAPPKRIDSNIHHSLSSLVDIRPRSPPPYNARHQKTGLRGPPVCSEIPPITLPLREPPPYPQSSHQKPQPVRISTLKAQTHQAIPKQSTSHLISSNPAILPEEVTARFITTRPHINILKAHTSVVSENPKPSFAAPTVSAISHPHSASQSPLASIQSTVGIPIVPYNLHTPHKSMSAIPPPPHSYPEVKAPPQPCVLLPVIKPRQYLPPPPPTIPRQPPPPPPPQLATVYTSQLARSQIELYQQQLYSDVDYVIYPLQDPAVSQQEYLDAKQGSILAAMAQSPPPPPYLAYHTSSPHTGSWDTCKGHAIYRSTPYLPMAISTHSRYASTQNLSDTYVQLPGAYSPLYSPSVASLCSSYEPPPPPPLRPANIPPPQALFSRSRSDDNILNSIETTPKIKRLPPPPPPYQARRVKKPPMPAPTEKPPPIPTKPHVHIPLQPRSTSLQRKIASSMANIPLTPILSPLIPNSSTTPVTNRVPSKIQPPEPITSNGGSTSPNNNSGGVTQIDIQALREKSKHLDLPLISALCNDRSLLKQTKAFVLPKHPKNTSSAVSNQQQQQVHSPVAPLATNMSKSKYPVSGLSTTQLAKPRKTSISHRHPNDKLPPLPVANTNNYVMDPTPPVASKHKSFNSQPSS